MIKSIQLSNFQSHKESKLELSDKVNIIVGSTDSGKTAILRSLNWLINNRPLGDSYRSNWGGETKVSIKLIDDLIERGKDKENFYNVNEEHLTAFDKEVPTEIKSILRFTEINLQKQLDAPFLLSETPGEVQRILNRISHLDKIDSCMGKIESTKREVNADLKSILDNIKNNENELKKYSDLNRIKMEIKILNNKEVNYCLQKESIPKLKNYIEKIKKNDVSLSRLKKLSTIDVSKLSSNIENWIEGNKNYIYLMQTIKQIKSMNEIVDRLKKYGKFDQQVVVIFNKIISLEKNQGSINVLNNKIESLKDRQEDKIELQNQLNEIEKEFHDTFPSECPLCGHTIVKVIK